MRAVCQPTQTGLALFPAGSTGVLYLTLIRLHEGDRLQAPRMAHLLGILCYLGSSTQGGHSEGSTSSATGTAGAVGYARMDGHSDEADQQADQEADRRASESEGSDEEDNLEAAEQARDFRTTAGQEAFGVDLSGGRRGTRLGLDEVRMQLREECIQTYTEDCRRQAEREQGEQNAKREFRGGGFVEGYLAPVLGPLQQTLGSVLVHIRTVRRVVKWEDRILSLWVFVRDARARAPPNLHLATPAALPPLAAPGRPLPPLAAPSAPAALPPCLLAPPSPLSHASSPPVPVLVSPLAVGGRCAPQWRTAERKELTDAPQLCIAGGGGCVGPVMQIGMASATIGLVTLGLLLHALPWGAIFQFTFRLVAFAVLGPRVAVGWSNRARACAALRMCLCPLPSLSPPTASSGTTRPARHLQPTAAATCTLCPPPLPTTTTTTHTLSVR